MILQPLLELPAVDVLVVGGGLAALRAAIEARRAGASVRMVCKGQVARSGASAVAGQGYSAAFGHGGDPDSPERHAEDTLRGGGGLGNPALVRVLCAEAPHRLLELEAWGAMFEKRDGRFLQHRSGGHSAARSCVGLGHRATAMMIPLRRVALSLGVLFSERMAVLELLGDDHGVRGVVGLDVASATPAVLPGRTTVLATGGAGQLFRITSNPGDLTGDGYALALAVGATLVDMEFYQFYPWRIIEPLGNRARICIQPWTFTEGAYLVNRRGERFMGAYDAERREAASRDIVARAIYDQIRRGADVRGGVRVDLSGIPSERFRELNPVPHRLLARHHLDPFACDILVAPEAHFAIGGVAIDPDGFTGVPGLFAAGEVAGGVHGADRLGDNALPEALVFGARAGGAAARVAAQAPEPRTEGASEILATLALGSEEEDLTGLVALRQELGEAMWTGAGIIRNAHGLSQAVSTARRVRETALDIRASSPTGLVAKVELVHLAIVGEALAQAALLRTESRGAHYREDYPVRDEGTWTKTIRITAPRGKPARLEVTRPASAARPELLASCRNAS